MRIPGFTAALSTSPSLGHYARRSFFSSSIPAGVRQQLRIGGLGATTGCCCTTPSGGWTCLDGGCESGCTCGCSSDGTPACACRAVSSAGFSARLF
jgi:hypothetical protein